MESLLVEVHTTKEEMNDSTNSSRPLSPRSSSMLLPSYGSLREEAEYLISVVLLLKQMVATPRNVTSFMDFIDKSNVRQLTECITTLKKVRVERLFFFEF